MEYMSLGTIFIVFAIVSVLAILAVLGIVGVAAVSGGRKKRQRETVVYRSATPAPTYAYPVQTYSHDPHHCGRGDTLNIGELNVKVRSERVSRRKSEDNPESRRSDEGRVFEPKSREPRRKESPRTETDKRDDREMATPPVQPAATSASAVAAEANQNPVCRQCGEERVAKRFHIRGPRCAEDPRCLEPGCGRIVGVGYPHCLDHETEEERNARQAQRQRREERERQQALPQTPAVATAVATPTAPAPVTAKADPEIEALLADV